MAGSWRSRRKADSTPKRSQSQSVRSDVPVCGPVWVGLLDPPQVRPCRLVVRHPCRTRSCRPTHTDPLTVGWGAWERRALCLGLCFGAAGGLRVDEPTAMDDASTRRSLVLPAVTEHNSGACLPIWPVFASTFGADPRPDASEDETKTKRKTQTQTRSLIPARRLSAFGPAQFDLSLWLNCDRGAEAGATAAEEEGEAGAAEARACS
jgi:hypothetical protein